MRKIWVFLLAIVAFGIGAFGAAAYSGAVGSFASVRIACELLNTAEANGILVPQQRADVIDRTIRELRKGSRVDTELTQFIEQFKTGCPAVPGFRG